MRTVEQLRAQALQNAEERWKRFKDLGYPDPVVASYLERKGRLRMLTTRAPSKSPSSSDDVCGWAVHHPKTCGPCQDCQDALRDYADIPAYAERLSQEELPALPHSCATCGAHFRTGEETNLREHLVLCASWMDRVPVQDDQGVTLRMLGDPDPVKLARHLHLYGKEGAEPWLSSEESTAVHAVIRRRSKGRPQRRMVTRPKSKRFSVTR